MIKKILIFNENEEIRIIRNFADTHTNSEIIKIVKSERDSNIVGDIVFRKFNTIYICFVIKNENELYILALINMFVESLKINFPEVSELNFIYQFREVYDILDKMFVGGYVLK